MVQTKQMVKWLGWSWDSNPGILALEQWFSSRGNFGHPSLGTFGNAWRHFWLSYLGTATGILWPGMLLNFIQCLGPYPRQRIIGPQMSVVSRLRNPCRKLLLCCCLVRNWSINVFSMMLSFRCYVTIDIFNHPLELNGNCFSFRWINSNKIVFSRLWPNSNNERCEQKIFSKVLFESSPCWWGRQEVLQAAGMVPPRCYFVLCQF